MLDIPIRHGTYEDSIAHWRLGKIRVILERHGLRWSRLPSWSQIKKLPKAKRPAYYVGPRCPAGHHGEGLGGAIRSTRDHTCLEDCIMSGKEGADLKAAIEFAKKQMIANEAHRASLSRRARDKYDAAHLAEVIAEIETRRRARVRAAHHVPEPFNVDLTDEERAIRELDDALNDDRLRSREGTKRKAKAVDTVVQSTDAYERAMARRAKKGVKGDGTGTDAYRAWRDRRASEAAKTTI